MGRPEPAQRIKVIGRVIGVVATGWGFNGKHSDAPFIKLPEGLIAGYSIGQLKAISEAHIASTRQAIRAELLALANSDNWRVLLEDRLEQYKDGSEKIE
jgi:hypothetical protein